jgi:hypothetical protein
MQRFASWARNLHVGQLVLLCAVGGAIAIGVFVDGTRQFDNETGQSEQLVAVLVMVPVLMTAWFWFEGRKKGPPAPPA